MLKPSNVNPFFVDKPPFFWDWIATKSFWSVKSAWHPYIPLMHQCWMLVKSPFLVAKKQQHPSQIRFFGGKNQNFPLHSSSIVPCQNSHFPAANKSQVELRLAVLLPAIHGLNPIESHQNLRNKYLQGVVHFDMFDAQIWSSQPRWVPPPSCQVGTPSFPNCLIYRYTPLTFIIYHLVI